MQAKNSHLKILSDGGIATTHVDINDSIDRDATCDCAGDGRHDMSTFILQSTNKQVLALSSGMLGVQCILSGALNRCPQFIIHSVRIFAGSASRIDSSGC
jgi:hypothetical protein